MTGRKEADWSRFANYLLITSISIGAIAGFASLLQGVVSGMALAFLNEFTGGYPGDSFFAAQAQPVPKAA
jgi:hypothetical protein